MSWSLWRSADGPAKNTKAVSDRLGESTPDDFAVLGTPLLMPLRQVSSLFAREVGIDSMDKEDPRDSIQLKLM
jgi:hypothetical protein